MWYEVLPSAIIIMVAMSIPEKVLHYSQKYVLGTPIKRSQHSPYDRFYYLRDDRLTGDAYKVNGLESIPDE